MARFLVTAAYDEDGDHELDLEVYLDYDGPNPEALTKEEVEAVFREIVSTGEIPEGWHVSTVEWTHGDPEEGAATHTGTEVELFDFDAIVRSVELGVEMHLELRGEVDLDDDLEGDEGE